MCRILTGHCCQKLGGHMTPDTFILLAKYNSLTNTEMNKHISGINNTEWKKEFGGYYKSIKALCNHIYIADFNWLKRFALLRSFKYLENPLFENNYSWDSNVFDTINEYLNRRDELDLIIKSLIDEMVQDDLNKTLKYQNWKGETEERNIAGILLHIFNHQTHHRGMISLYLEFVGKENDFSNLVKMV
jgi:uncharacterized damage-inducible protein DinB